MITFLDALVNDILLKRNLMDSPPEKQAWYKEMIGSIFARRFTMALLDSLSPQELASIKLLPNGQLPMSFLQEAMQDPDRTDLLNAVIASIIDEFGTSPVDELQEEA